jgi:hypothetical protein
MCGSDVNHAESISEAFVLTRPVFVDIGKGEDALTIQAPGHLPQHLSPDRIAVLESIPGEARLVSVAKRLNRC